MRAAENSVRARRSRAQLTPGANAAPVRHADAPLLDAHAAGRPNAFRCASSLSAREFQRPPLRATFALTMAGQGSAGNVLAAICSFFIPGLGQLVQGRLLKAALMFVLAAVLWMFFLGWIVHLWSIFDAAVWKPR